jgi:hypothetical protein
MASGSTAGNTSVSSSAYAYGGAGGAVYYNYYTTSQFGSTGNGGNATATASAYGASSVSVTANATGGAAYGNQGGATNGTLGFGGNAIANAFGNSTGGGNAQVAANAYGGTSAGYGGSAFAVATATGGSGLASSTASSAGGLVTSVVTASSAQIGSTGESQSQANVAQGISPQTLADGIQATAFDTGLPLMSDSLTALDDAPLTHRDFDINGEGPGPQSLVLGLGTLGGSYSSNGTGASHLYSSDIVETYDTSKLTNDQDLIVGMINARSQGLGFDSLQFDIKRAGTDVVNVTFTNVASANAFFKDNPMDLGSITAGENGTSVTLEFDFNLTASEAGAGYNAQVIFGNATVGSGPVPEPAMGVVLIGMAGLLTRRVRRHRPSQDS